MFVILFSYEYCESNEEQLNEIKTPFRIVIQPKFNVVNMVGDAYRPYSEALFFNVKRFA